VPTDLPEPRYTDRDITQLGTRLAVLHAATADPVAPAPLRNRAAEQASRVRAVIDRHEATRQPDQSIEPIP